MTKMSTLNTIASTMRPLVRLYGDMFDFYATGSWARNEEDFRDYDIAIVPHEDSDMNDWESLLMEFYNKKVDGKRIDAQIVPRFMWVSNMSLKQRERLADAPLIKYIYGESLDKEKYKKVIGNLYFKKSTVVPEKHKRMGLHKVPLASWRIG